MRGNTIQIELPLKRGKVAKTIPLYQYDYGQNLVITGAELPEAYEVHFANEMHGEAVTAIGGSTGVAIPDSVLTSGEPVYLWLYLHEDSTDGETEFQGVIPVIKRASISDQTPTPEEQSAITQAIAALNAAVTATSAAQTAAEAAQTHIENMGVGAVTLATGDDASVTKSVNSQGEVTLTFGLPRGEKGDRGDSGEPGEPGNPGADGEDGFSPVVSLTKSGTETTLSITDATGTSTVTIEDGEPGDPTELIDDNAGEGDTGLTWSADKIVDELGAKYEKPGNGIPASDLADGVIPDPEDLIDDTAGDGDTDKVWSADKSSSLLTQINSRPETKSSDATNVDLDVSDENGNVLLRLKDGHIKTKNFSSDDMVVRPSNASEVDLDITDGDGNVIARFSGGHIKTKEFDSRKFGELSEIVNPFYGKKYAALGDSITYGFIPRNYEGYPGQLDSFAKVTAQRLGMTFVNKGIEGSTLAYHASRSPMSRRYNELPDDADIVTVMGGTNDIRNGITLGQMSDRTDATYYGALHVILGGLYKKYFIDQGTATGKKKKIIVCTPIKLLSASAQTQGGEGTLVDMSSWVEAVKEVAAFYSMPVMDFYNLSNINPHISQTIQGTETGYTGYYNPYITDGTHPTQEGAYIMADAFVGFLKTLE